MRRKVPDARMPAWLMVALVALGLPRTILADLGVVTPQGSWIYFVLALTPFTVWLAVAVLRPTDRPITDHVLVGALYGLSLAVVHEALWSVASSLGHHPPQGAVDFAAKFDAPFHDMALHGYTFVVAMMIGLGSGLVAGLVAAVAMRLRATRERVRPASRS